MRFSQKAVLCVLSSLAVAHGLAAPRPNNGYFPSPPFNDAQALDQKMQEAKNDIVSLIAKYQILKESTMDKDVQYETELEALKTELSTKESYFTAQVDELKNQLRTTQRQADQAAQNSEAAASAREARYRKEMEAKLAASTKKANNQAQEAKKEVSSLLDKYQTLKDSSTKTQMQYQNEVVELKDQLRKKETDFNSQLDKLKNELKTTQTEADRKARDLEAARALQKENLFFATEAKSAKEAEMEEAKKEVSSLLEKYQDLQESSMNTQIQYKSEIVSLKDELRKKETYFGSQVAELKKRLEKAESEADHKAQKLLALGSAREAKLRNDLTEAIVAESRARDKEAKKAKKEVSSLLRKYQDLQDSTSQREDRYRHEVADLKERLSKVDPEDVSREQRLRKELADVVTDNEQLRKDLERLKECYKEEIMDLEDRLEGEQQIRMKQQKQAALDLARSMDETRKAYKIRSDETVILARQHRQLKAQEYEIMQANLDLTVKQKKMKALEQELGHKTTTVRGLAKSSWALTKQGMKRRIGGLFTRNRNGVKKEEDERNGARREKEQ